MNKAKDDSMSRHPLDLKLLADISRANLLGRHY